MLEQILRRILRNERPFSKKGEPKESANMDRKGDETKKNGGKKDDVPP